MAGQGFVVVVLGVGGFALRMRHPELHCPAMRGTTCLSQSEAERNASRPSKKSMGRVFDGKLLQEPKRSVQNFLQIQSQ